jgi:undecaprenyl phosphate-alpha-L-ara4FN deformylase
MLRPDQLNVLTIHAEVEGGACLELFQDFLFKAQQRDIAFAPLGDILGETGKVEKSRMVRGTLAGRDGWVACQDGADSMEIHDKVSKR